MNSWQRGILAGAAAVAVLMMVFPPFHELLGTHSEVHLGYFPIFAPPLVNGGGSYPVNTGLLAAQWLGLLIVAGLLFAATRK